MFTWNSWNCVALTVTPAGALTREGSDSEVALAWRVHWVPASVSAGISRVTVTMWGFAFPWSGSR